MKTSHRVRFQDARKMGFLPDGAIDLVLTSPPYPMIAMWDETFTALSPAAGAALKRGDGRGAFSAMHRALDPVWAELYRVLRPGGFACINIGDATRTVGGRFMLYPNHARILAFTLELGFTPLPAILWRKPTNAPTKFLGSGMFPAGAYVTLEHEHILVLRKSDKREFDDPAAKQRRRESAIFWEERNTWFSDVWMDLRGSRQALGRSEAARARSGAFPPELAYRLILMFSVKGDTVLDPFLGTGTTLKSAAMAGRNSVGIEIQKGFRGEIFAGLEEVVPAGRARIRARIDEHLAFIARCRSEKRAVKHVSRHYGFPVVTRQETGILLNLPEEVRVRGGEGFDVSYREGPHELAAAASAPATPPAVPSGGQIPLF